MSIDLIDTFVLNKILMININKHKIYLVCKKWNELIKNIYVINFDINVIPIPNFIFINDHPKLNNKCNKCYNLATKNVANVKKYIIANINVKS